MLNNPTPIYGGLVKIVNDCVALIAVLDEIHKNIAECSTPKPLDLLCQSGIMKPRQRDNIYRIYEGIPVRHTADFFTTLKGVSPMDIVEISSENVPASTRALGKFLY